jgi:5-formyltetrahydrofolate cyclo-ligase
VNKSLLRKKIFKIKKKKFHKDLNINPDKFIEFLKINKFKIKNIGGYYPSNYEIDDLSILELLGKKNYRILLPTIKKIIKWTSANGQIKIHSK